MHLKMVIVHIVNIPQRRIHDLKVVPLVWHVYENFHFGSSMSLLPLHCNVTYNIDLVANMGTQKSLSQKKSCIDDVNIWHPKCWNVKSCIDDF
jgi:hypothetical protein